MRKWLMCDTLTSSEFMFYKQKHMGIFSVT